MPIDILMPALSPTMEEGKVSRWLKKEGDPVKPGDVIAEIETDKATMEVEAVDEGTMARILVPEGTEGVKVNTPIAILSAEGEDDVGEPAPANAKPAPAAPAAAVDGEAPASAKEQNEKRPAASEPGALPAAPREPVLADPDVPEDTEMVTMTVREALRDAMAEEMRRDPDVFVMGEEVAEYQGAYKVTQGLLQEFGPQRVVDTRSPSTGSRGSASAPRSPA